MIRRPPRSTLSSSSAASDVYKRQVQAVGAAHIGVGLVHGLLITFGLLSLAVAALLTLTQRDYKRLLAYSSIEHMGVIALGVGSGTSLGLIAALLHMLGHGLVK